jgi:hypothetical protein
VSICTGKLTVHHLPLVANQIVNCEIVDHELSLLSVARQRVVIVKAKVLDFPESAVYADGQAHESSSHKRTYSVVREEHATTPQIAVTRAREQEATQRESSRESSRERG